MSEERELDPNGVLLARGVLIFEGGNYDSSQDNFQPVLRRRGRQRLGSTQDHDHDYVHTPPEQELIILPASQRRSVDVIPWQEEEEQSEDEAQPEPEPEPEPTPEPPVADQPVEVPDDMIPEDSIEAIPLDIDEASNSNEAQEPEAAAEPAEMEETERINLDTPSPPKKRKRISNSATKAGSTPIAKLPTSDDEDDGTTCPICLDSWEMSGEHRLVSLRCGHLFGESCIRRWLTESMRQSSVKVCPQCKTKATNRDMRYLYARRLRAIDRSEEHRLRNELDAEKRRTQSLTTELAAVKMAHTLTLNKFHNLEMDNARLRDLVRAGGGRGAFTETAGSQSKPLGLLPSYRLYMEKNFEITREPGCRVLLYSSQHSTLVASQRSSQSLFPGYGMRFIDPPTFKPLHFLHTSAMQVRDVCFSTDQNMLAVASRETRVKVFDIRSRQCSAVFSANDKMLWSCGMDRNERENFLYLGDSRGVTYVYDVRFPDTTISEFKADDCLSPVIDIASVPASKTFCNGGFLVCQLTLLTFYEYENETAVPSRLNIEGPFLSMHYDVSQDTVLISVRSNAQYPQSRFILGKLAKIDGTPVFEIKATILGAKATPVMTRATQLGVESNTLVVGYLQDSKQLILHDVRREERVQTLPVNEVVYDICPVSTPSGSYLAALTDNKCRIYKLNSSGGK
ncbi:E3 ubiquitin-protein ligase RFWD3 [Scaptodrosophila lebanonensis]|uniref:RING-type E3 ubiquitin transferase n=1 Tax=Drosophila lebanonensis TaxID=7225 RepID=A0A6J2UDE0_DROLE|nr:E3 ubiquitin-protein ligase RFWD3 [Scaptodrosophila lebanonensis]